MQFDESNFLFQGLSSWSCRSAPQLKSSLCLYSCELVFRSAPAPSDGRLKVSVFLVLFVNVSDTEMAVLGHMGAAGTPKVSVVEPYWSD